MEYNPIEVAKTIGQPIDSTLPTPVEISEICDVETAEFGEDVYYFASYDDNTDIVYTAGDAGEITSNRKSPTGATSLTFVGLQSDLAYVTINELQNSKDQSALARKKVAIGRSMDKYEVKRLLDVILAISSQEVELATGDDIYSGILAMIHKVVDYGDNFVLLAGSTVWEAINTYDRDHVTSFNYHLGIKDLMKDMGVSLIKVAAGATVALDTTSSSAVILSATKAILVARDSKLKSGKPCLFVRRKINPEVAAQLGFPVDSAERMVTTIGGLQIVNNKKNILGYGVVGYECNIQAVTNYKAIAWCDELCSPA